MTRRYRYVRAAVRALVPLTILGIAMLIGFGALAMIATLVQTPCAAATLAGAL